MRSSGASFATYAGAAIVSSGLVGLVSANLISNAMMLSTGVYIQLWVETILLLVSGFVLLTAAFLIGSLSGTRQTVGGLLGVLSSLLAAIDYLALLNSIEGITGSVGFGYNPQISTSSAFLYFGGFITLFVAFPLGMMGSFKALQREMQSVEPEPAS